MKFPIELKNIPVPSTGRAARVADFLTSAGGGTRAMIAGKAAADGGLRFVPAQKIGFCDFSFALSEFRLFGNIMYEKKRVEW